MFSLQFCDGGFDHGLCFGHDGLILGDQAGHGLTHAAQLQTVHPAQDLFLHGVQVAVGLTHLVDDAVGLILESLSLLDLPLLICSFMARYSSGITA